MATALLEKSKRMLRLIGVDRAIGYTIFGRFWTLVTGPVTVIFIAGFLSKTEQGFYYAFSSVLGVVSLFELGLSSVILQFTSHERAHLEWTAEGTLAGNDLAKGRMARLIRLSFIWYGVVAMLIIFVLVPLGIYYFHNSPESDTVTWLIPWMLVAFVTAAGCALAPLWAVLEGSGLVADMAFLRILEQVGGTLLLWASLALHLKLFAAFVLTGFGLARGIFWVLQKRRALVFDLLRFHHAGATLSWWGEVWPLQWKVAGSYIAGYLSFQIPPLILFHWDPKVAGQWGMTGSVAGTLIPLGTAWVQTKVPTMCKLIVKREFTALNKLFMKAVRQSMALVVLGAAGIFAGLESFRHVPWPWANHLAERLLPDVPFVLMLLVAVMNSLVFSIGAYLRAHKEEPILPVYMLNGMLVVIGGLLVTPVWGARGLAWSCFLCNLLILLIGTLWIFRRKARHSEESDAQRLEESAVIGDVQERSAMPLA